MLNPVTRVYPTVRLGSYLQMRSDIKLFHFFQEILSLSLRRSSGNGRGLLWVSMKQPTSSYGTSPVKSKKNNFMLDLRRARRSLNFPSVMAKNDCHDRRSQAARRSIPSVCLIAKDSNSRECDATVRADYLIQLI